MKDQNLEDSSDSEEEYGGLSMASLKIGDGASLYMQTMKALSIMFVLLTVFNIPLILLYKNNTNDNIYNLNHFFTYFTIGNLAETNNDCGYSVL